MVLCVCVITINSSNPHNSRRQGAVTPFYRWGGYSTESSNSLLEVTQMPILDAGIKPRHLGLKVQGHNPSTMVLLGVTAGLMWLLWGPGNTVLVKHYCGAEHAQCRHATCYTDTIGMSQTKWVWIWWPLQEKSPGDFHLTVALLGVSGPKKPSWPLSQGKN